MKVTIFSIKQVTLFIVVLGGIPGLPSSSATMIVSSSNVAESTKLSPKGHNLI